MTEFVDFFQTNLGKVVGTALALVALFVLTRLGKRGLNRYIQDTDTRYRARKFVTFFGFMAGVIVVATVFSERLGGLTVALAAASAGVAFALQEVIVSIAGWIAIWSGGLYSVGDRVQVGGSIGDVIDIGVLRTTLMECGQWIKGDNYTGRVVRVSNSFIFKEPVYNYSGDFRFLWDEITVPVKFGSDVARARALLERAVGDICGGNADAARADWARMVDRFRLEDARVDPMVTLIFNDNWIEFTLRYVVHYQRRRLTKDELFTRILADVDATQGAVGLASATFHLVETPVFDVRLRGPEDKK